MGPLLLEVAGVGRHQAAVAVGELLTLGDRALDEVALAGRVGSGDLPDGEQGLRTLQGRLAFVVAVLAHLLQLAVLPPGLLVAAGLFLADLGENTALGQVERHSELVLHGERPAEPPAVEAEVGLDGLLGLGDGGRQGVDLNLHLGARIPDRHELPEERRLLAKTREELAGEAVHLDLGLQIPGPRLLRLDGLAHELREFDLDPSDQTLQVVCVHVLLPFSEFAS